MVRSNMAAPHLFRILVQVSDIDAAAGFYAAVLGMPGERVAKGRHYFHCAGTILALLDPSVDGEGSWLRRRPATSISPSTSSSRCARRSRRTGVAWQRAMSTVIPRDRSRAGPGVKCRSTPSIPPAIRSASSNAAASSWGVRTAEGATPRACNSRRQPALPGRQAQVEMANLRRLYRCRPAVIDSVCSAMDAPKGEKSGTQGVLTRFAAGASPCLLVGEEA